MNPQPARGADFAALTTGRPPAVGARAAVTSPHYLATEAGFEMLRRGGHAVDAAIAVNAVLAVVYNHMAGMGGDLFAQVWDAGDGTVRAMNGSGRSGKAVTADEYERRGETEVPARGPLGANTVPGTVDAWAKLHERYGRLPWRDLFEPAIGYANDGHPLTAKMRDFVIQYRGTLQQFEETARVFMPDGRAPDIGELVRQPALAESLRAVAEGGADEFYRGPLAEQIVGSLREAGGLLTAEDFAEHSSDWVDPVSSDYKGLTVTELPPNTQGLTTLLILNIIETFDLQAIGDNTADFYHLMTEATKLAFALRDRWVADPAFKDIPVERLLSKESAEELRGHLDMQCAKSFEDVMVTDDKGDTTFMAAVDTEGNTCSLIQSVYYEFGSAFMPEATGILLQNRGSFFKLDRSDPNFLEPGKRPFHTIIPAMALRDGRPFMAFGTMGGEGQPQTQTAMLTRVVDFGYDVQQAIEAPRWLYGRTWGEESRTLKLEGRIPDSVSLELERRGHEVENLPRWSGKMGHAQAIVIMPETGIRWAGADPRGDGLALAY
jgi:gamma-glutamyltranspeptidase/glutathione hydrolase